MSELKEMQERGEVKNILGYLMYGIEDTDIEVGDTYQRRIDNAHEKIFSTLEQMFPNASRYNNDLCRAVMDFSITLNKAYLEMGLIMGFQICKNFDTEYQNMAASDIQSVVEKLVNNRKGKDLENAGE